MRNYLLNEGTSRFLTSSRSLSVSTYYQRLDWPKMALRSAISRLPRRQLYGLQLAPQDKVYTVPSAGFRSTPHARSDEDEVKINKVEFKKPTIEMAKEMPREYHEFTNSVLVPLALHGDYEAIRERLVREVMVVEKLDHRAASEEVAKIAEVNRSGNALYKAPYYLGIGVALGAGLASFPLCFDINATLWFNDLYVTTDVADSKDLETPLEVGSWAWGWMEPPLGQISFFLLCLQWARGHMVNIQVRPYTDRMLESRACALAAKYPLYNEGILKDFSKVDVFK